MENRAENLEQSIETNDSIDYNTTITESFDDLNIKSNLFGLYYKIWSFSDISSIYNPSRISITI